MSRYSRSFVLAFFLGDSINHSGNKDQLVDLFCYIRIFQPNELSNERMIGEESNLISTS